MAYLMNKQAISPTPFRAFGNRAASRRRIQTSFKVCRSFTAQPLKLIEQA
jgi:hypothetical protein